MKEGGKKEGEKESRKRRNTKYELKYENYQQWSWINNVKVPAN